MSNEHEYAMYEAVTPRYILKIYELETRPLASWLVYRKRLLWFNHLIGHGTSDTVAQAQAEAEECVHDKMSVWL